MCTPMNRLTIRLSTVGALCAALALPSFAQTPAPSDAAPRPSPMQHQGMMGQGHAHGAHEHAERHAKMGEHRAKHHAARAEALKQKLQLSPAQESAWTTFTTAMQPGTRPAMPDRAELAKLTTPERLDRMRTLRTQRATEMDQRAEAVKAFYATLTPEQQKTFDTETAQRFGHHGMGPMGPMGGKH